jgi:hypothetical protein
LSSRGSTPQPLTLCDQLCGALHGKYACSGWHSELDSEPWPNARTLTPWH